MFKFLPTVKFWLAYLDHVNLIVADYLNMLRHKENKQDLLSY